MLSPGKIQHILCTGNLVSKEAETLLKQICSDLNCARGDFDETVLTKDAPEYIIVKLGAFRIGVIHGHQVVPWGDKESLAIWQRKLDVDILIFGGTHQYKTFEYEGKFFINPGSMTGAFSGLESECTPTFVLMDINNNQLTSYVYQLENDDVKVKKKEFTKA
eukprot:NODE_3155_length_1035_cov_39.242394_g2900_i0.p1 GENE.NODE_3155_length_1035_cov_39.242394_g2900_i0~~NODE_3155_length_1035_cov_39.242394_g2900_i0.p1  ORF type:complete len:162 (-),score=49.45 NODE_3155_length_1035_cov_39.242394_g2900_i0:168-653(-)